MANNIHECLTRLQEIDGFIGASVADAENGLVLGTLGGGGMLNMDMASAANAEVVKAKRKAIKALKLTETIEDILITLDNQYHLIRPLKSKPFVFFYLALNKHKANLALARYTLTDVEGDVSF